MPVAWPFAQMTLEMAKNIYDHHHEGILICDHQARFVYYNQRMGQLDGLDPDEVLGHHLLEVYNLDHSHCISTRCLSAGRPVVNEALYYRTHKGGLVNAICNAYPIYENKKLVGSICYTAEYTSLAERLDKTARNYARHPYSQAVDGEHVKNSANGAVHTLASIVGESPIIKSALETAKVSSKTPSSVLIFGETGTGKELFAQAIHNYGPRRAGLFCPINCAAIPENLLEGLLFGTVRGAFTGAMDRKGLFELSNGGAIFLDELHTMPMGLQVKLLRAIQERRVRRLGSQSETGIDVKIISSINMRPEEAVEKGHLRPDLFYRLGVVLLSLPPLRLREGDVPELVRHFVKKYNKKFQGKVGYVEPEFLAILGRYAWPGNVRELEHVVETSMNFAVSDPVNDKSLGLRHIQSSHLRKFLMKPNAAAEGARPGASPVSAAGPAGNEKTPALSREMAGAETHLLTEALEGAGGNRSRAARNLGISRQALYYKIKKYGIKATGSR